MADSVKLGEAHVDVTADDSKFDEAMDALPRKARAKVDEVTRALEAKVARGKLEIKVAMGKGDTAEVDRLIDAEEKLRERIDAVTAAARRKGLALAEAARAAEAGASAPSRMAPGMTEAAPTKMAAVGAAGKKMGADVAQGSGQGAMGLMILSQTIDDAQYGRGCRAA
jgi:uncharacterized protein YicC (UPF0701 family)